MASKQEARVGIYYGWVEDDKFADQMDVNLLVIAFLLNPAVISKGITSLPAGPADGDAYIVAASGATGSIADKPNNFVVWNQGVNNWLYLTPKDGQQAVVTSVGTWGTRTVFKGGLWSPGVALG